VKCIRCGSDLLVFDASKQEPVHAEGWIATCGKCKRLNLAATKEAAIEAVNAGFKWRVICDEISGKPDCMIVDEDGYEIATVNHNHESWKENAELIAAAPEMLQIIRNGR